MEFREHLGGRLTIMLLSGIGRGVEVHAMDEERIEASIARLRADVDMSDGIESAGGVSWSRMSSVVPSPSAS
jgi:3-dehydroquinate synthase